MKPTLVKFSFLLDCLSFKYEYDLFPDALWDWITQPRNLSAWSSSTAASHVEEEDLVKIHLYTRMQLSADSALWMPMLPLYPRFRSVDLLTFVNWIKSCARQEDLSHHPPSPTHTHNCIQSCTNQTAILVAYLLLLLLVPCGKQIIMAAHSESGQLLSHLDPKMWVSFHYASGITGSLWMSNISVLK